MTPRALFSAVVAICASPALSLTETDLRSDGFATMDCMFDQRCVIGQPCERAWRDMRWMLDTDAGRAHAIRRDGAARRASVLMKDARWKDTSQSLAILSPMREAVASHLTVFDGGGAIMSVQYAGSPGSGQFLTGRCEVNP